MPSCLSEIHGRKSRAHEKLEYEFALMKSKSGQNYTSHCARTEKFISPENFRVHKTESARNNISAIELL